MPDLAMHILDIVENSTRAEAKNISLDIVEDSAENIVSITIIDDGKGMTEEELKRALDPFYTTKKEAEQSRPRSAAAEGNRRTGGRKPGGEHPHPAKGPKSAPGWSWTISTGRPSAISTRVLQIIIATNPGVMFDITYTVDGETENFSTRDDPQGNGGVPDSTG